MKEKMREKERRGGGREKIKVLFYFQWDTNYT